MMVHSKCLFVQCAPWIISSQQWFFVHTMQTCIQCTHNTYIRAHNNICLHQLDLHFAGNPFCALFRYSIAIHNYQKTEPKILSPLISFFVVCYLCIYAHFCMFFFFSFFLFSRYTDRRIFTMHSKHIWCHFIYSFNMGCWNGWCYLRVLDRPVLL